VRAGAPRRSPSRRVHDPEARSRHRHHLADLAAAIAQLGSGGSDGKIASPALPGGRRRRRGGTSPSVPLRPDRAGRDAPRNSGRPGPVGVDAMPDPESAHPGSPRRRGQSRPGRGPRPVLSRGPPTTTTSTPSLSTRVASWRNSSARPSRARRAAARSGTPGRLGGVASERGVPTTARLDARWCPDRTAGAPPRERAARTTRETSRGRTRGRAASWTATWVTSAGRASRPKRTESCLSAPPKTAGRSLGILRSSDSRAARCGIASRATTGTTRSTSGEAATASRDRSSRHRPARRANALGGASGRSEALSLSPTTRLARSRSPLPAPRTRAATLMAEQDSVGGPLRRRTARVARGDCYRARREGN
jgi:hypothetical protein